ncbi:MULTISPECIES: hypothetical protein [Bacillaceae]|uniref:Uncharacterized protein n=1 Tax=Sutcliffiella horikoshii TaxID=79883 RepID=A0A5D4SXD2_9BACI|nr:MULTISPECIES: hypothetical protein [Bacillaceae]TYS67975.1 hypothetical protein FZC75_18425 [Sutcliffiella horikoshii]
MQDFIIILVILSITASPILYFRIGKKKIGYLNLFTVGLFLVTWGTGLWMGIEFDWNIIIIFWFPSLIISTLLLLVAASYIFYKVAPNINRVLLPLIILVVMAISYHLNRYVIVFDVSLFFDIILVYLTPMFLFTILIIGAFQYDRGVGRQQT